MLRITNGKIKLSINKSGENVDETSKPQIENKEIKFSKLPKMGLVKFMGIGDMRQLRELEKEVKQICSIRTQRGLINWSLETEDLSEEEQQNCIDANTKLSLESKSKKTSPKMEYLLENLSKADGLNDRNKALVKHWQKEYDDETKIPDEFTEKFCRLTDESQLVYKTAKQNNDYAKFAPNLAQLISCTREQAHYLNPDKKPYDVLLNEFDEGVTTEQLDPIFNGLKEELVPFIKKINAKVTENPSINEFDFKNNPADLEQMNDFCNLVLNDMGFDPKRGQIGKTVHPFMTDIDSPKDVRIAVKDYSKGHNYSGPKVSTCLDMIATLMHETGHALLEQNTHNNLYRTGLTGASYGIHESQSRLWENMVGKSKPFWNHYYPKLQEKVDAFKNIPFDDFYRAINTVKPSLIRTESDEVTYNLHVMLRYDLEKEMMDNSKDPEELVKELPQKWNNKMEEYLGIRPNTDSKGVLQDSHWSGGGIGYFPSYSIGNLASAQIFNKAKSELGLDKNEWNKEDLKSLKDWLTEKIYKNGTIYTPDEIIKNTTGEPLNPKYFTDYIKDKYSAIYDLD